MNTETINDETPAAVADDVVTAPEPIAAATTQRLDAASIEHFASRFHAIAAEVRKDILSPEGEEDFVGELLTALFAKGHVLLESRPGLGKTTLVRSLGTALGLQFGRVQFTPDLMPADITGTTILRTDERGGLYPEFQSGPIFANILLADEINRASPKTQAALARSHGRAPDDGRGRDVQAGSGLRRKGTDVAAPDDGHRRQRACSTCWPRRTRSSKKAPTPCPKRSWTGSSIKLVIPSPDDDAAGRNRDPHHRRPARAQFWTPRSTWRG